MIVEGTGLVGVHARPKVEQEACVVPEKFGTVRPEKSLFFIMLRRLN